VKDFAFSPPSLGATLAQLWRDALILLIWLVAATLFALRSARHLAGEGR